MANDVRVFDADVHIHEHDADLAPYMEQPWRRVLEGGAARGSGRDVAEERFLDVPGYHPLTQYDPNLGDYPPPEGVRLTSADSVRTDMDTRGVDAALLFTGRFLRAAASNDAAYCAALGRAYNRYLQEWWVDARRGMYGAIMAVNQSPVEAAEEIERYAAIDGFIAVYLPGAGNYPLWGDRMYDPIFAAAERCGLPVVFQGAITIHTVFPYQLHHLPTALAKQAISQPFGAIANLVSMATTGVLSRFPALRIVFNDAGLGWLPMIMERLDHVHPYLREETPFLEPRPSDAIRRQIYVTTHPWDSEANAELTRAYIEAIGPDHVLFGSDWPHFGATTPDDVRRLAVGKDVTVNILECNARALFGSRLPA